MSEGLAAHEGLERGQDRFSWRRGEHQQGYGDGRQERLRREGSRRQNVWVGLENEMKRNQEFRRVTGDSFETVPAETEQHTPIIFLVVK